MLGKAEALRRLGDVRSNVDGAWRCWFGSVLPKGRRGTEQSERSQSEAKRAVYTLAYMTFAFSQRFIAALHGSSDVVSADELEVFEVSGRRRWAVVRKNVRSDRSVADGSVSPLIKLGLIQPLPQNPSQYELTESGVRLCRDYWRRSDADDPTLPRQSVR